MLRITWFLLRRMTALPRYLWSIRRLTNKERCPSAYKVSPINFSWNSPCGVLKTKPGCHVRYSFLPLLNNPPKPKIPPYQVEKQKSISCAIVPLPWERCTFSLIPLMVGFICSRQPDNLTEYFIHNLWNAKWRLTLTDGSEKFYFFTNFMINSSLCLLW